MPTHHGGECIRLPAGTANNGSPVVLPRRHPRAFRAHARASHRRNSPLARAEAKKLAPRLPRQKAAARAAAAKEAALADKARALARRAPALPHLRHRGGEGGGAERKQRGRACEEKTTVVQARAWYTE